MLSLHWLSAQSNKMEILKIKIKAPKFLFHCAKKLRVLHNPPILQFIIENTGHRESAYSCNMIIHPFFLSPRSSWQWQKIDRILYYIVFLLFRENLTMPLGLSKFSTTFAACAVYQPQFFSNIPLHSKVMPHSCGRSLFSNLISIIF